MKLRSAVAAVAAIACLGAITVAPAEASKEPRTARGAVAAARHTWVSVVYSGWPGSAPRGLADLGVSDSTSPGGGCRQLWGYTGARWKVFSLCTQDGWPYPTLLPGSLQICRGTSYTLVRTRPSPTAPVLKKVKKNTTVRTDQFKLVRPRKNGEEGLGFYRVGIAGKQGWVASYRITGADDTRCGYWKSYWKNLGHR